MQGRLKNKIKIEDAKCDLTQNYLRVVLTYTTKLPHSETNSNLLVEKRSFSYFTMQKKNTILYSLYCGMLLKKVIQYECHDVIKKINK